MDTYTKSFILSIKEDILLYFEEQTLNESGFYTYGDAKNHYYLHVCQKTGEKPDAIEEYTGKVIWRTLPSGSKGAYRILFPYMTLPEYSSRANKFLENFDVGTSDSEAQVIGWVTNSEKWRGKKTSKLFVKFRHSDLEGPKEHNHVEYIIYEPIYGDKKVTIPLGDSGFYVSNEIVDRKIISYGLCRDNMRLDNAFPFSDELPISERGDYVAPKVRSNREALEYLEQINESN